MPMAAASAWRRGVTALLVFAVLALSAAQGWALSTPAGANQHHDHATMQVTEAAAAASLPHGGYDHGLACCVGSACAMQLVYSPAASPALAGPRFLTRGYAPSRDHRLVPFAPAATTPPPRSAV